MAAALLRRGHPQHCAVLPLLAKLLRRRCVASSSSPSPWPQDADCHMVAGDDGEDAPVEWDKLGFGLTPTDYMYITRCSADAADGSFSFSANSGELARYGDIRLSPCSGVLNYGQGLFEGLKAYRRAADSELLLFRPEENALRMQAGAERMCMPAPAVDHFVAAVKQTVAANRRWVPPAGKGALYLRPLLLGTGAVLGLAPAPEYTFLIYAAPVGTYFKSVSPLDLYVDDHFHRSMPGGTGGVKTIANYAPVLRAQQQAKGKGFSDVLYLDAVHSKFLEEASSCNLFIVKDGVIATPSMEGTILPGITRKSIIELARDSGFQVEERRVSIDDLIAADEAFCTGTAVVVAPVGSVTYKDQKYEFKVGEDTVSQKMHKALTEIQMGLAEDTKGWTAQVDC